MKIQSLFDTIIKPKGKEYNNEGKLGSLDFTFNTSVDVKDFSYTNRVGIVVSLPPFEVSYQEGWEVLVHHNVFRRFWNQQGHLNSSGNKIMKDTYSANQESIFAYRENENEPWKMTGENILVYPVRKDNHYILGNGVVKEGAYKGEKILFSKNSEYEFRVDGELFYKMRQRDIVAKL